MKSTFALILLAAAIAVAISFFARQQTLNELRVGNESRRRQLEPQMAGAPNPAMATQPTNSVAALSADERTELLRLRGQILPLQAELQAASNHVTKFTQAKSPRPVSVRVPEPTTNQNQQLPPGFQLHQQVMEAYRQSPAFRDAQDFSTALRKYLSQNGGQLPDDLAKVEAFAGADLRSGVSQRFELMHSGPIPEDAQAYTLFAREKEPQQQSDGWVSRIYYFADGTMNQVGMNSASPDWGQSERNMETRARNRSQRGQGVSPR